MADIHKQAEVVANKIEGELKVLARWDKVPLSKEKYKDMGTFGSNTMSFVQWLQFVLLPRIREIVKEESDFPAGSMLTAYAIREFQDDPDSGQLIMLLYELDQLVNWPEGEYEEVDLLPSQGMEYEQESVSGPPAVSNSISLGDTYIPPVLFTLARVLPELKGAELERQLKTFDSFLAILSPAVRPAIRDLLKHAAEMTPHAASRSRIENAERSVANGGCAAG